MKVDSIKIDLFDCTGKDEKRFRIYGFTDMLDTDDLTEALDFISGQVLDEIHNFIVDNS